MQEHLIDTLDQEWIELIIKALEMGITSEEIRSFLLEKGNIPSKIG